MELLWVWCFLGAALVLAQWPVTSSAILKTFLVVLVVFGAQIVAGIDPQEALSGISGNNISVIVLLFVLLLYMKREEEGKKISYWPCAAAILLSLWGNGRAGLLASALLTALVFLYDYVKISKFRISTLIKIGFAAIVVIWLINHYFGNYLDSLNKKVEHYGYSSSRSEIWAEYLRNAFTSLPNFLFGVLANDNTPLYTFYGKNTHNAFLMLHEKYGIICFVFVVYGFFRAFFTYIRRKKAIFAIMMAVWFCRSMFDWTGFPGIFDALFFYFMIHSDIIRHKAQLARQSHVV